jgi:hypothetical protein
MNATPPRWNKVDFGAATLVCTPASHDPFRRQRPSYTRAIDTQSARRTRRRGCRGAERAGAGDLA